MRLYGVVGFTVVVSVIIACAALAADQLVGVGVPVTEAQQSPLQGFLATLLTGVVTLVVAIFGWIGTATGKLVAKKLEDTHNDMLQKIAYLAVRWAEDKFKGLEGSEKFKQACQAVAAKLPGVTQADIEQAVHAMYQNFSAELPPKSVQ